MHKQLILLFQNISKTDYLLLRGYESLPFEISNDLDFFVEQKNIYLFFSLMEEVLFDQGFLNVHRLQKDCFEQRYYAKENFILKIDVWTDFIYRGLKYIDKKTLISNGYTNKFGLKIINLNDEVVISVMKEALHMNRVKKNKIIELTDKHNKVGELNSKYFSPIFLNTFVAKSLEQGKPSSKKFQLLTKLLFSNLRRLNLMFVISNFSFLFKELKLYFNPKGKFIVFIGPDGAGKSLAIDTLTKSGIINRFSSFNVSHARFNLIPRISKIINIKSTYTDEIANDLEKRRIRADSPHSWLKANIYASYYLIDYFFGNIKIRYAKYKNQLIIFDRYYYDYFTQRINSNTWSIFPFLYRILAPQPNIVFIVQAPPKLIYSRKQELNIDEINNQLNLQRDFNYGKCEVNVLNNTGTIDDMINDITKKLIYG
mgnify:CR=1 FL=1|jgi:thymidylate kinase|tara:strand:- start:5893 stop:7173 length:1281 start_codon:yes stop_codon:yes gene_type:complete